MMVEGVGGSGGRNGEGNLANNGAVIGVGINLKKSDGGLFFTVNDLPGSGGGATILG